MKMTIRLCRSVSMTAAFFLILGDISWGIPMLDASNDVGGGATARELRSSNFWAQSFTTSRHGLLTQVDVQIGKFAGATNDVTFELRPLVNGLPTVDGRDTVFTSTIDIDDIPTINSLADPPPFFSVDVSGAGIRTRPGDVYAISLLRGGIQPAAAAWRSRSNSYADGTGFFRPLLNAPWEPRADDLGFQTWIDPTPTDPYRLRVDATYDVQYRPGDVSSLIEGESSLIVGGIPGSQTFPEQRPLLEFPIADLPENAVVDAAQLELNFGGSSGAPRIEVTGFPGDGIASFDDATTAGATLAITPPTSATSPDEVPIDASYVASLAGEESHLGIRMRSLDLPQYVSFSTLEAHSSVVPPRLAIEYSLVLLEGDYNENGIVDAADFTVWRDNMGGPAGALANDATGLPIGMEQYDVWVANFGMTSSMLRDAVIPEPSCPCVWALLWALSTVGRRCRRAA